MKERWCFYCLKNSTIFRDTNRNQDSSSWEEMQKFSIRDHILFFTNYIIKIAIWDKAWFVVCLLIWLVLFKYVQLQSLILKILWYTITFCIQTPEHVTNNCDPFHVQFFLIIYSDLIKNLKANLWEKFMACIIKQLLPDCRLTEYYRSK